jgi:hypothetical protein
MGWYVGSHWQYGVSSIVWKTLRHLWKEGGVSISAGATFFQRLDVRVVKKCANVICLQVCKVSILMTYDTNIPTEALLALLEAASRLSV